MQQLFGLSEQTWLYLDQFGILIGNVLMLLSIIGAIYGTINRDAIRRWLNTNRFPGIGGHLPDGKNWDGLVFTVSRKELPIWVMQQVKPRWVGLLLTEHSAETGEALQHFAAKQGIDIHYKIITDADEPNDTFLQTKALLQKRPANINYTAVDITGGKTPMSLGAFMAAEETGADSIYVASNFRDNKPDMSSARIICVSQFQE